MIDFARVINDEPQQLSTLDAEAACKVLKAKYEPQIKKFVEIARDHEITDETTQKQGIEIAAQAKKLTKAIEKKRKELIDEPYRYVQTINKFCKVFKDQLADAERSLKNKINKYLAKLEAERREAERKAQEEARKLQEQLAKEAQEKGIEAPTVPEPIIPEKKVHRSESGAAAYVRKVWTWEEVDFSQVPDEYKMLDTKKINQAVKAGIRNIPGLRIFQKEDVSLRA